MSLVFFPKQCLPQAILWKRGEKEIYSRSFTKAYYFSLGFYFYQKKLFPAYTFCLWETRFLFEKKKTHPWAFKIFFRYKTFDTTFKSSTVLNYPVVYRNEFWDKYVFIFKSFRIQAVDVKKNIVLKGV